MYVNRNNFSCDCILFEIEIYVNEKKRLFHQKLLIYSPLFQSSDTYLVCAKTRADTHRQPTIKTAQHYVFMDCLLSSQQSINIKFRFRKLYNQNTTFLIYIDKYLKVEMIQPFLNIPFDWIKFLSSAVSGFFVIQLKTYYENTKNIFHI